MKKNVLDGRNGCTKAPGMEGDRIQLYKEGNGVQRHGWMKTEKVDQPMRPLDQTIGP